MLIMRFDQHILICNSFQTEILCDAQILFVDVLAKLHPSLWSYIPKLVHLFDILSDPGKLKKCQFKIELAADNNIWNASLDSELLIDAFEYLG